MLASALILVASVVAAPPSLEEFLRDFEKERSSINALITKFEQTSVTEDETLTATGEITYIKPRRIIYSLYAAGERPMTTLVDQDRVFEYEPSLKQVTIYNLADRAEADAFFLGFDSDSESLQRKFEIAFFEPSQEEGGGTGLELKPKDPDSAMFLWAKLYLRPGNYLPYRIHIQNEEAASTVLKVEQAELNPELDPAQKLLVLPGGTEVYEDNRLVLEVPETGAKLPDALGPNAASPVVVTTPLAPPAPQP